jgi:hypothetical protein
MGGIFITGTPPSLPLLTRAGGLVLWLAAPLARREHPPKAIFNKPGKPIGRPISLQSTMSAI